MELGEKRGISHLGTEMDRNLKGKGRQMPQNRVLARGVPASSGVAEGKIAVVNEIDELPKVQDGDILVVRENNPAWTLGMMKASAFVSEFEGIISHTAIIAREMGLPCIVAVKNATQLLSDGMRVRVDGDKGIIYES